jgi:hypothetical protein
VSLDESADQAQLGHGGRQFVRRRRRILQRQDREPAEPVGMVADDAGQEVVHRQGGAHRDRRLRFRLNPRGVEGKHLHVKAEAVHLRQAFGGEVKQPA